METPKTLQTAIQFFSDYENCRQFMVTVRWLDGVVRCPRCNSEKITYLEKARLYRCYGDHPKQKFSLKVGTVFEDSPIPLEKWLPAVWLLVSCKNGISSYELAKAIGVTQKSAWFMLHRIRTAVRDGKGFGGMTKLGGPESEVEVDETFVDGRKRNMHKARALRYEQKGGAQGKAIIQGILDRTAKKVRAEIVPNTQRDTLQTQVLTNVRYGTKVYTDDAVAYDKLHSRFVHEVVNKTVSYVRGRVHVNGIENFWSLLKRGLNGTYVSVEPFHLFRYVDEQIFRFNNRATKSNPLTDADRFHLAISQIAGKRLTFAEVTGKVQETAC
jgi:transposase-like protein